jgi:bis(5'-nucleosidyl)-tetraphosphatase
VALERSIGAVIKYQSPYSSSSSFREDSSEFLLLKNRRGFWGFPQGHKKKGESEIQTLVREVLEETGIKALEIQSYIGKIQYSYFKGDGMKSDKEVRFYFATTPTHEVKISDEHADFRWVTLFDALNLLDHAKLKLVLTKGHMKGLY